MPRLRFLPLLGLLVPFLGAVTLVPATARAKDDPPVNAPVANPGDPPPKPAPPPLDPKLKAELIARAREYFDPEGDPFLGRTCLRKALELFTNTGVDVLSRMPDVRDFVYQGRSFLEPYSNKKWQKENGLDTKTVIPGKGSPTAVSLKSEKLRLTYSIPKSYKDIDFSKVPRPAPLPLLFTLHDDKEDYKDNNQPGDDMMVRRYGSAAYKSMLESWLVLAPVAARGKFVEDGLVKVRNVTDVFSDFCKRYHVDFDRVILDGEAAALAVAASQSVFYAGIVLRRGETYANLVEAKLVPNFASVPVYVVGCPPLSETLRKAGHPDVTCGDDAGVVAWMNARKRVLPKKFTWRVQRDDQVLAYWVNIDVPEWSAPDRTLDVEVVDTDKEPNTIKIKALGIQKLTLFLNDEIVDLGREVRIVVNGHEEKKAKFNRNVDRLFDKDPMRIRRTMYFGWLFPVLVDNIGVSPAIEPEKPAGGEPAPAPPVAPVAPASEADEDEAALYLAKAQDAETAGEIAKAITLYEKAVGLGNTRVKAECEAKLVELKAKLGAK